VTHRWRFAVTQTRVGCIDRCEFGRSLTRTLPSVWDRFGGSVQEAAESAEMSVDKVAIDWGRDEAKIVARDEC